MDVTSPKWFVNFNKHPAEPFWYLVNVNYYDHFEDNYKDCHSDIMKVEMNDLEFRIDL